MAGPTGRLPLSVLIPTRNEERNVAACIESVRWADEVIVFDSLSTDRTAAIASEHGARVVQRQFDNFADHKNWALREIPFRHQWVLIVDADERATPELAAEIAGRLGRSDGVDGFHVARKNLFDGVWLKHGGMYPDWQMRLLRRDRAHYERRLVHEHVIVDGRAEYLREPLVHHNDNKGFEQYFERHNVYSSMEAVEIYRQLAGQARRGLIMASFLSSGPARRRALKHFAYAYLPFRPLFVFVWMYLLRLGVLDGRTGLRYALLRMVYEFQIDVKLAELRAPDSPMRRKYGSFLPDVGPAAPRR